MTPSDSRRTAATRTGVVALALALAAGCAGPRPASTPPAPDLQLIGSAALDLPHDCLAAAGRVYRTLFDVQPDGRVSSVRSAADDGCVQQALREWVATFSYASLRATTPVAFDWLAVTASRRD
jgi:hypothetical protein